MDKTICSHPQFWFCEPSCIDIIPLQAMIYYYSQVNNISIEEATQYFADLKKLHPERFYYPLAK